MLRIRLRRTGKRNNPCYRIIVCNCRVAPAGGKYIEQLGLYNPKRKPPVLEINRERLDFWLKKGAKISDTLQFLLKKADSSAETENRESGADATAGENILRDNFVAGTSG